MLPFGDYAGAMGILKFFHSRGPRPTRAKSLARDALGARELERAREQARVFSEDERYKRIAEIIGGDSLRKD